MLESFHLGENLELVDRRHREKNLISAEILGQGCLRMLRPEAIGERSRFDLMWNGENLGIRGPAGPEGNFRFYPLTEADTPVPAIQEMMSVWMELKAPLAMAQIRFRAGWQGLRGIWIDCANLDIKNLLAEERFLRALMAQNIVVELGQKHKELSMDAEGNLQFLSATPRCWLPSFDSANREILLESTQAIFSQPSSEVNRALIATAFDLMEESRLPPQLSWCEWGAGYGNLSAAFYSRFQGERAWASEFDSPSAELLKRNAARFMPGIQVAHQTAENEKFPAAELWIADPPRPGFNKLFGRLREGVAPPRYILTFHCHQNGLLTDSRLIREAGFRLLQWSSVDAFPATPHHEVLSLWMKDS